MMPRPFMVVLVFSVFSFFFFYSGFFVKAPASFFFDLLVGVKQLGWSMRDLVGVRAHLGFFLTICRPSPLRLFFVVSFELLSYPSPWIAGRAEGAGRANRGVPQKNWDFRALFSSAL